MEKKALLKNTQFYGGGTGGAALTEKEANSLCLEGTTLILWEKKRPSVAAIEGNRIRQRRRLPTSSIRSKKLSLKSSAEEIEISLVAAGTLISRRKRK